MRTNIFKTMLVAAAAMAFASCSKDATTDLAPSRELSGVKKNVTITASFESATRTALEDHQLTWVDGDTFGILAADDKGILENIPSPKYETGKTSYSVEVPAETTTLYCYYPYSEAYDKLTDIADFTVNIPNFYSNDSAYSAYGYYDKEYAGEFLPQYHFMAAVSTVTDDDVADVVFTPLVSIVEFNLYDTTKSGEKFTTFNFNGGGTSKTNGNFTVNFNDKTLTAQQGAEDGLGIKFDKDLAITLPDTKEKGTKIYLIVPKGEYANASFQVGSVDHEFATSNGYFNDLEWEKGTSFTADGHTVNIDLKHALPAPLAEPLSFTQVDGNPFFATIPVLVQEACDFFAIRVYDTETYNKYKDNRNNDGKNQYDELVEALYDAYVTEYLGNSNSSKIGNYGYAPSPFYPFLGYNDESITDKTPAPGPRTLMITEDWQLLYDGLWNSETEKWDRPGHKTVLKPGNDYTFVAYAKARPSAINKYGTDFVVYETEFKTPDLEFNGSGTLTLSEPQQTGSTATVKVTGTNIKKFVYWVVGPADAKPKNPLTGNDLVSALNHSDIYFQDFSGEYTITQKDMNPGDEYIFCVAGVDNDGKLVAANQVKASAADIEFDGYEITKAELASQPTKLGEVELTFTVEGNPKYLRIYTGAQRNIDGSPAVPEQKIEEVKAQTWDEIQKYFKNNTSKKDYAEVAVEGKTVTTKITFSEPEKILPDGEYERIPNPGHSPIYILIVGADEKGDAVTKLGNIYQITGEYSAPQVEICTENIHRGVKEGDSTHTIIDETAYFYSCPVTDFGDEKDVPNTDFWDKTNTTLYLFLTGGTKNLLVYKSFGATIKEAWLFRLATGVADDAFSYANTNASRQIYTPMIQAAFSEYSNENLSPNSSVQVLKHYGEDDIPTNYQLADPYVPEDIAVGDLYVVVGRDADNKLFGRMNLITKVNGSGFNGTATTLW